MYEQVVFRAFSDELQKIAASIGGDKVAMPKSMLDQAGKMFGGAKRLVGQGLPKGMQGKIPTKVPRPGQLKGRLAPPARAPRPSPRVLGPVSRKAPPPPAAKKKSPIDWTSGGQGLDFSGR